MSAVSPNVWRNLGLLLLLGWLTFSVARLAWLVAAQPNNFVAQGSSVNLPLLSQPQAQAGVDIETFAQLNPFGKAAEEAVVETVAPSIEDEAQETRLQLELQGVFATGDATTDKAIIANGANQSLYAIGDALPGGASVKLSKVLADRIVIENNGRYELLWLYDESSRAKPAPAPAPRSMRSSAKISQDVAQRFVNDKNLSAESIADVVKISLKRDGPDVIGFEVRPGRDRDVFDNLGLQSGDIVTAVNGTKLSDAATAVEVAKSLRDAKQATLTIMRRDQETTLDVSLE
ncbi:hypothetical protein R50072_00490 [Simiduia litorea]|uniref:type II secretion system protein GspC n=1 Tax=Simiduia litorea TaxID=1435348 RepID=UPI0036F215CB